MKKLVLASCKQESLKAMKPHFMKGNEEKGFNICETFKKKTAEGHKNNTGL